MNTLTMALRPPTGQSGARATGRAQVRWLGRLGAALWDGLQEARQARPERELLELIERPSATHFAHPAQFERAHALRASGRRRAEARSLPITNKEYSS